MARTANERTPRRFSRRALLGWGAAAGLVATGGLCYALSRLLSPAHLFGSSGNITDLYTYSGHTQGVNALAWSPDGTRIASSSRDGTVQIWESATGHCLLTYSGHAQTPQSVSWSPDSTRLVSAGIEGSVQVWRVANGKPDWIYQDQEEVDDSYQLHAAWSPDGASIATVGLTARMPDGATTATMLWDATSGQQRLMYNDLMSDDPNISQCVAWAPDSARIVTGGYNQEVIVWPAPPADTAGQGAVTPAPYPTKIWDFRGEAAFVYGLAWSPDGTRVASCGSKPIVLLASNGGVRIWNATNGQRVLTYLGHSQSADLRALAWSPNGKYIASGGTDQVAHVWDALTGEHLATYSGHINQRAMPGIVSPYAITAISWSPDSARIASSAFNGPVHVWKFSA